MLEKKLSENHWLGVLVVLIPIYFLITIFTPFYFTIVYENLPPERGISWTAYGIYGGYAVVTLIVKI